MKKLLFPVLVVLTLCGAAFVRMDVQKDPSPKSLLQDRPWIDHMPRTRKDSFDYYILQARKRGFFAHADSVFRFHIDVIAWSADDNKISFLFQHDERRGETAYTVEKLSQPVDRMDLKLELKTDPAHDGKPQIYYGSSQRRDASIEEVQNFIDSSLED